MPNMKATISSHNKNILDQDGATAASSQQPRTCNCRNKPQCPLQGNCMQENVPQKRQQKTMSALLQISKSGKETIRHPSGTLTKETRLSYQNTSGNSKTERSRFALNGEY